jgi:glycosyltransferase involved in cell wall biosynthesis
MRLDILIPTYNRGDFLKNTIESVFASKPALPFHLTIIDNNSSDGTEQLVRAMISRYGAEFVSYVHEGRQGKSFALNAGIAATSGELVGFIDDDEEIHPEWLQVVQNKFGRDHIDFLGGPYLPIWEGLVPPWLPRRYRGLVGSVPEPKIELPYDAHFPGMLMGGNAVIARNTLNKVGPFSTATAILRSGAVLASGYDRDMYARLLRSGAKGLYTPDLIVFHHIPKSRLTMRYLRRRCFYHGQSRAYHELVGNIPAEGIRWRVGKALRGLPFVLSQLLIGRSDKSTECELACLELAGYATAKIRFRPGLLAFRKKISHRKRILLRRWEGEQVLKRNYRKVHGRDLDWRQPQLFSEKMFRRMVLMNRSLSPEYTELSDKYLVRNYVAKKVGEKYLTKIYWEGFDPAQIPFDQLPEKCVIKTNHGSGQVIVVKGNIDRAATVEKLRAWLSDNYYWKAREYQYFGIRPRALIEEYLDDGQDGGPLDYRFWCFNGKAAVIQVDNHRHDINPFYDADWNKLDLSYRARALPADITKPANLDEMHAIAASLAAGFDFVRVDLYNLNGRICFGELTFTPLAGQFRFAPEPWDAKLGEKWLLPA